MIAPTSQRPLPRGWTFAEEKLLRDRYRAMGPRWCAEQLGRSRESVASRAKLLGLLTSQRGPRRDPTAFQHRGVICPEAEGADLTDLDEPTYAPPGSADKLEVLARRAARGFALYHPLDGSHSLR